MQTSVRVRFAVLFSSTAVVSASLPLTMNKPLKCSVQKSLVFPRCQISLSNGHTFRCWCKHAFDCYSNVNTTLGNLEKTKQRNKRNSKSLRTERRESSRKRERENFFKGGGGEKHVFYVGLVIHVQSMPWDCSGAVKF